MAERISQPPNPDNLTNRDYRARAAEHAPKNVDELRAVALGMLRDGYGDHTIAAALSLDVEGVRRLIGSCTSCGG